MLHSLKNKFTTFKPSNSIPLHWIKGQISLESPMNFSKMESLNRIGLWVLIFCLVFQSCCGLYLSGSYPNKYDVMNELWVKVNPLTSIDTELPLSYYTLPFCEPQGGVEYSAESLGKFLTGDRVENSPYKFKMYANESEIFLCWVESLSGDKFNLLKKSIDEAYQVSLMLDNLPAIGFTQKEGNILRRTEYPVGIKLHDAYYLFNHLKFNVLVHKYKEVEESSKKPRYMVVGFEVIPCSVKHNIDYVKHLKMYNKYPLPVKCNLTTVVDPIKEGQPLVFTYEVAFGETDIKWESRWDSYLKVQGAKEHSFRIFNMLMFVNFAIGITLLMFLWGVRMDFAQYEELDKETQAPMKENSPGWRLVMEDVFRTPSNPTLLCVMVGNGVQILGMVIVSLIFATLGFMSRVSRRTLILSMLLSYMILGAAAGYVAVRLWRQINQKGWMSVALKTTFSFGSSFWMLTSLNFILWGIPNSVSFIVISMLLWFCISVPLTLVGGYFGARAPLIHNGVRINAYPRNIPHQDYPSWILVPLAGSFPYITVVSELIFVMSILKISPVYHVIGLLFFVLVHLMVICAEVSLFATYIYLNLEDWAWWWKSFFASGSIAIFIFLLCISYLDIDLKSLSGGVVIVWLGYSFFMALAIMVVAGTIGFLFSFWFVYYLFSSVKLDEDFTSSKISSTE